jgi:cyanophycinase
MRRRRVLSSNIGGNAFLQMRMTPHRSIAILAGSVAVLSCASQTNVGSPSPARRSGSTPGRLVIVGGALNVNNAAVYRAILDARSGSGPFCVFPTAGATPDSDMASPVATFERYGGTGSARGVLVSSLKPETASDPAVVAQIRQCSGFFFIGGIQSRVTAAFRPEGKTTPAYDALVQRWREGAVVSGSSAGAAIMSDPMIAGGTSAAAISRGVKRITYTAGDADDTTGGVTLAPGLGFFSSALADQHFLARGRFGRLLTAMLELREFDLAFGIDENTALVVDRDSLMVVGASGVVVFDERSAKRTGPSVTDVTLHLLGDGDRFDLRSRRPALSSAKLPVAAAPLVPPAQPTNAFARFELLKALDRFSRSPSIELALPMDTGRIVLRKQAGFMAVRATGAGVQDTPSGLAMTGIRLDILR